jgi:hypothetical protein
MLEDYIKKKKEAAIMVIEISSDEEEGPSFLPSDFGVTCKVEPIFQVPTRMEEEAEVVVPQ